jgi:hypothetical protein
MEKSNRSSIFISYSHEDIFFVNKMKRHFSIINKIVDVWDDSKILAGHKWMDEITNALNHAKISVIMISADFFSSKFITDIEFPSLLKAAQDDGLVILSVILKPCLFSEYPEINQYQAINSPSKTISQMTESEQEETWVKLAARIHKIISEG